MNPKALVTGHQGFVGRHLVPALVAAGYDVVGTEKFEHFMIDYHAVYEYDVIIHLAANIVNVHDRMKLGMRAYDDIVLDKTVCQWVEEHPPKSMFIVMSSCAVDYPSDPYCIVKRTLEDFAMTLAKKMKVKILRPFSGYGPDQSLEYPYGALWDRALKREEPLRVWGGNQVRDWLWIDDLVGAIMFAVSGGFPDAMPIEIGTGVGTSLEQLARDIAATVGYEPVIHCDFSKARSSMRRVRENPVAFISGWAPGVTLSEGLLRTKLYFKNLGRL